MATITSTIKLVDQMTPTLNKISRSVDALSKKAANIARSIETANSRIIQSNNKVAISDAKLAEQKAKAELTELRVIQQMEKMELAAKRAANQEELNAERARVAEEKRLEAELNRYKKLQRADYIAYWKNRLAEEDAIERAKVNEEKRLAREAAAEKKRIEREIAAEKRRVAAEEQQWNELERKFAAQRNANITTFSSKVAGLTTHFNRSSRAANNLLSVVRRLALSFGLYISARETISTIDTMLNATARLGNLTKSAAETAHYMDAIYAASQRSRGNFMEMVNSVGKLGTVAGHAFDNVEEMIAFTELMNKLFVISGASAAESSNAMYQLTQAMAAGRLQGDEMRSILENAPMLAQRIADYMGVSIGEVKKLGAEGVITADIIKAALFGAADDIEERYSKMPKTIGQIWTQIKNHALNAFRPVIERIQKFLNSPTFQRFQDKICNIITQIANGIIWLIDMLEDPRVKTAINAISDAFVALWNVVCWVGDLVVRVAKWICDNWSTVSPIVYGIVAAFLAYKAVLIGVAVAQFIMFLAQNQWLLYIVAIIAAIGYLVRIINILTGQSLSACGVIVGAIGWVLAFLWNILYTCFAIAGAIVLAVTFVIAEIIRAIEWVVKLISNCLMVIGETIAQFCSVGAAWFEVLKANTQITFLNIAIGFVDAFNSMISSAGEGAAELLKPFVSFANGVIDLFNSIIDAWNSTLGGWSTSITNPFNGDVYKFGFDKMEKKAHISADTIIETGSTLAADLRAKRNSAILDRQNAKFIVNRGVDWGAVGDSFNTFDLSADGFKAEWDFFKNGLSWLFDSSHFVKENETFNKWYEYGANFENGVTDIIGGIGALLGGLLGEGSNPVGNAMLSGVNNIANKVGNALVPKSMEDLLGGSGSPNDLLGAIADNTGAGAGSAANIDDTLDMAEDELELLRKIAEKEVVNRFTTAEIKVNMTNNNNVNSKMDLDGIVTHLSTKLYEELGVVASGVHY